MMNDKKPSVDREGRISRYARVAWAFVTLFIVESMVFGLSVLPAALFWEWHFSWTLSPQWLRVVVLAMSFVPSYMLFAVSLMVLSGWATRITGWRTPPNVELKVSALDWELLDWARYMVSTHLVRIFAGVLFRSTPVWTMYHRLNGGRIGHGVYINSISLTDHNLLEFDDRVVIGSDVHLSGHTVEAGVLKTARVKLGRNVTIGIGSVVGIGVEVGADAQVGALSVVPKFRKLEPGSIYGGDSIKRLDGSAGPLEPSG
jgi:acetyltransferase-like isoleucine patch superfamily enzyme